MAQPQQQYLDPLVVSKLKHIEMKARLIVEGFITGLHRSPYHGFSVEFAEHRPYNAGESLRNIDWKVYGKTDKLFTKKYEEETNLRCHIVLDVSDSMRYPYQQKGRLSKLEYSAYLAAAMAYMMLKQRDAFGLTLFDTNMQLHMPPKAKQSWLVQTLVALENVVKDQEVFVHRTATPEVLHQLAQKVGRRGFVILLTDLFTDPGQHEALFPALQHLRHAKHEVLIFNVLDHQTELEFEFSNRPLTLKDLETGEMLKVQPEHVKKAYQEAMKSQLDSFERRARELQVDFVPIDIATPYDKALTDYLIKRKRLVK